jgi:threonylcarbamoyladenosine tRNA methylthiotransferase MtaB
MLSVLVYTLGCKLNQLESEALSGSFMQAGFSFFSASAGESPSVIIINTCTVTSKADQKARRVIRKALRDYPDSPVLVTGCYAQLDKERLIALDPRRDGMERLFVLKGMEKDAILDLPRCLGEKKDIRGALKILCGEERESANSGRAAGRFQFNPERFSDRARSFLKIQDGCDKHCTYCRIRLARGPSVSLDAKLALERLRVLEKNYAEAVITGVNICRYRDAPGINSLGELLDYLLAGTEKIALRLSSLAPESIDEDFARILSNKRIRPHFHLSVQSASEKILERMGRSYNAQTVEKAVSLLRGAKGDPFLACDIITGFPGETEAEFEKTRNMCEKTGFAWTHIFPYSGRPGTPAWSFSDAVPEKEISRRVKILTDLAWQGRGQYIKRWLGQEVEALVEKGKISKSSCRAVSENYLKLLVVCNGEKTPLPGSVLRCVLLEENDLPKEQVLPQGQAVFSADCDAIARACTQLG